MGFTELLDDLGRVGPRLASSPPGTHDAATADVRNEINAALLPVWQWLDGLRDAAEQNSVDWVELDGAPSDEAINAVKGAIAILSAGIDNGNLATVTSELAMLGALLERVIEETDARLAESGVDSESRNRLLLPLRAHVSDFALTRGSSEALSLARQSLGKVGERRLSEGVGEQVEYERKRADRYRFWALIAFVVSISWLIASYLAFRSSDSAPGGEWVGEAVTRLGIGSAVLVLAVYLSREASQHRASASGWRSLELQMDTIDLYCASLPPAHRDAVRLAFGLEVFSGSKLFASASQASRHGANGDDGKVTAEYDRLAGLVSTLAPSVRTARQSPLK